MFRLLACQSKLIKWARSNLASEIVIIDDLLCWITVVFFKLEFIIEYRIDLTRRVHSKSQRFHQLVTR